MELAAYQIAELINGKIIGNPDIKVNRPSKIENATEGSVSFIANPKYEKFAVTTDASILIVGEDFQLGNNAETVLIIVKDPYSSFSMLLSQFEAIDEMPKGVQEPVFISDSAKIGKGASIGAFSYIGNDAVIGDNAILYPHTYIGNQVQVGPSTIIYAGTQVNRGTIIGSNCIIHSGVVVGSDGFGFAPQVDGSYKKIPQTGYVEIGDYVEIGANSVIDRATLGATKIGTGVKIDNLVQVAHNVEIGDHSVIAAQAGISGSTKLGRHVVVGGQAGFVGHLTIADRTQVNAQSGVSKSVEIPGSKLTGSPARNFRDYYKSQAVIFRLPEIEKRIASIEKKMENNTNE